MDYRNICEHLSPSAKQLVETNQLVALITEEDHVAERELMLYIDNDSTLYTQKKLPIYKNMAAKMKKGVFNDHEAVKGFMYLVDAGAQKYAKDFGGTWNTMFPKPMREKLAKHYVDEFKAAFKNKEYDFMK